MSQNTREIEIKGPDVETAIQNGLTRLGVGRNDVIIEVVDEGSRGLLGIGSRDAVVRLTSMVQPVVKGAPREKKPADHPELAPTGAAEKESVAIMEEGAAVDLVRQLLDLMGIEATVSTRQTEPDDLTGRRLNVVEINGDDLGVLIGPRGDTLNALQYVARLMVGHKIRGRADFVVDVQGYRQRREQALSRLAERMAQKVAARRRPISLEPMPPHERRIIHLTLRDDKEVYTQSVGEGKRRKVRIIPK